MEHLCAYREWIVSSALPLWSTKGFDTTAGRFRERLGWGGAPADVPHRAMVQARQIYVFSHASHLGWFPEGRELAERAMTSMRRDFGEETAGDASFAFSIDGRGGTVSAARDAYTHAFVLFAIAWLHRVNGDPGLLDLADRIDNFVHARLFDARHGGMFDEYPTTARTKRQNPLMHLLEAYLALERAAPGRGYLSRARELIDLFTTRLFDARRAVLLEYFAEDWSAHPDAGLADVLEPGHHFEWVWLLGEYERLAGVSTGEIGTSLYRLALTHGVASDGLISDELTGDKTLRTPSHRVWPHAEAIKAAISRHRAGDTDALAFADLMARSLLDRFLDQPFKGGWIDHVSETGAPLVDYVPASTLYHLFFAAAEAAQGEGAA
ncbi:MAG: AGE family epimerase/isomerase [bacterium]